MTDVMPLPGVAIAVAPNGGRKTKADHPAIPLSPGELAKTAQACLEAGAAMIHAHVRKADGSHLLDADAYREVINAVRQEVGDRLLIQITSEALGIYSPGEQIRVVKATRPEAASLAYRELVPSEDDLPAFLELLHWMKREKVLPQIIVYDPLEAARLADLRERGDLPYKDIPVLYVLGRYTASQTSTPGDLLPFLDARQPRFSHWTACAFGRYETACLTAAALLGGNVRTGFENNTVLPDGREAPGNKALVASLAASVNSCGIGLADADALRAKITRSLG
ncbi:3-keto-5-aminohexanoate cleavage protein [Roseibium salinum]|uniref:3-keto-5-aminohexanoate cleavage protein n=1 Tax=Roseibium salinum TaxID=1604349 RepID=A0ABT3QWH5_9HYPH|nr:3-keto-5-aminohexanoate cleavage protein [Roseibium sp. DSM 29163]MCX2721293.1 3-keto-5-aminohexanoate cleavage protein [Roseibium sp. DSM 29163]